MYQPNTTAKFMELNRKVSSATLDFERHQSSLRVALQQAILHTEETAKSQSAGRFGSFESAWLPGPLSYPWLVVIVSLPKILETFFQAV